MARQCRSAVDAMAKRAAKGKRASRGKPVADKIKRPDKSFDDMMSATSARKILKSLGVKSKITPTSFIESGAKVAREHFANQLQTAGVYCYRRSEHTVASVVESGLSLRHFEKQYKRVSEACLSRRGKTYRLGIPTNDQSAYTALHTLGGKFPPDAKKQPILSYAVWVKSQSATDQFRRDAGYRAAPKKRATIEDRLGTAFTLYLTKHSTVELYRLITKRFGVEVVQRTVIPYPKKRAPKKLKKTG